MRTVSLFAVALVVLIGLGATEATAQSSAWGSSNGVLVFRSDRDGEPDLFTVDASGSGAENLTPGLRRGRAAAGVVTRGRPDRVRAASRHHGPSGPVRRERIGGRTHPADLDPGSRAGSLVVAERNADRLLGPNATRRALPDLRRQGGRLGSRATDDTVGGLRRPVARVVARRDPDRVRLEPRRRVPRALPDVRRRDGCRTDDDQLADRREPVLVSRRRQARVRALLRERHVGSVHDRRRDTGRGEPHRLDDAAGLRPGAGRPTGRGSPSSRSRWVRATSTSGS